MKIKDDPPVFDQFFPVAEAISKLLYPHAEVVIHDLTTETVVAIFNNFSKRKRGDESLLEEDLGRSLESDLIGPYSKINWDGKKLRSISSCLRDSSGAAVGLMCINLDVSVFEQVRKVAEMFLGPSLDQDPPRALFRNDWREKINSFIDQHLRKENLAISTLTRKQQRDLISLLHKEGAFEGKNAAAYIAQILGVSRATVYNQLKNRISS